MQAQSQIARLPSGVGSLASQLRVMDANARPRRVPASAPRLGSDNFNPGDEILPSDAPADGMAMFRFQRNPIPASVLTAIELRDRLSNRKKMTGRNLRADVAFGYILAALHYQHRVDKNCNFINCSKRSRYGRLTITREDIRQIVGVKTLDGRLVKFSKSTITRCLHRAEQMGLIELHLDRIPGTKFTLLSTKFAAANLSRVRFLRQQLNKKCKITYNLPHIAGQKLTPHLGRRLSKIGILSETSLVHTGFLRDTGSFTWLLAAVLAIYSDRDSGRFEADIRFTSLGELSDLVSQQAARFGIKVRFSKKTISRCLSKATKLGVIIRHEHRDMRSNKAGTLKIEFNEAGLRMLETLVKQVIREDQSERRGNRRPEAQSITVDCSPYETDNKVVDIIEDKSAFGGCANYSEEMLGTAAERAAAEAYKRAAFNSDRSRDNTPPVFSCTSNSISHPEIGGQSSILADYQAVEEKEKDYSQPASPPQDNFFEFNSGEIAGSTVPGGKTSLVNAEDKRIPADSPSGQTIPAIAALPALQSRGESTNDEAFSARMAGESAVRIGASYLVDFHAPGRTGKAAYKAQQARLDDVTAAIFGEAQYCAKVGNAAALPMKEEARKSQVTIAPEWTRDLREKLNIFADTMPNRLALLSRRNVKRVSRIPLEEVLLWQEFVQESGPNDCEWFARLNPNSNSEWETKFADYLFSRWRSIQNTIQRLMGWTNTWREAQADLEYWNSLQKADRNDVRLAIQEVLTRVTHHKQSMILAAQRDRIKIVIDPTGRAVGVKLGKLAYVDEPLLDILELLNESPIRIFATLVELGIDLTEAIRRQRPALQEWAKRHPVEFFRLSRLLPIKAWAGFGDNILAWLVGRAREQIFKAQWEKLMGEFYGCGPGGAAEFAIFCQVATNEAANFPVHPSEKAKYFFRIPGKVLKNMFNKNCYQGQGGVGGFASNYVAHIRSYRADDPDASWGDINDTFEQHCDEDGISMYV